MDLVWCRMCVKSVVRSRYENLLAQLDHVGERANAGPVRRDNAVVRGFRPAGELVTFEYYVVLERWPARPGSQKEYVDIIVRAREVLSGDASELVRSTVDVSYFSHGRSVDAHLHTLRFDFAPSSARHPVFHAQLDPAPLILPPDVASDINCRLQFDTAPARCCKEARIPTCEMTLGSVLVCVVADHVDADLFAEFFGSVLPILQQMPLPSYEPAMFRSISGDCSRLGSFHWFAHTS